MITSIHSGTSNSPVIYTQICPECECIFEFLEEDTQRKQVGAEAGIFWVVSCPECHQVLMYEAPFSVKYRKELNAIC